MVSSGSEHGSECVVGCVALIPRKAGRLEVSHMTVSEEYRNRGIGTALLQACMRAAAIHKCTLCLSVLGDLTAARSLYARHGFLEDRDPQHLHSGCTLYSMVKKATL